ncbi:MAG: STAS domain-containing protein [Pseudomonadales bacterium]|nr:STAS domain-containing protein [Pseudomonadales bacterium]MDP4640863.1 STAS domain-containing protein [Pseudomonadales bacterium]
MTTLAMHQELMAQQAQDQAPAPVNTVAAAEITVQVSRVVGRLDADFAQRQRTQLEAEWDSAACHRVIDLADVNFIDSSGLGLLVLLCKKTQQKGFRFAICNPSRQAQMLFELTRLHQLFGIFPSEALACQALQA